MTRAIAFLGFLFTLAGPGTAVAGWTHEVSFSRSEATSIKVVEPEGFKVAVTVDGEVKTDSVPAVFTVPDGDGYYEVAVTAADGATWSRKIEVRAHQQTALRLRYTPEGGAAPAPPPSSRYIGRLKNTTHACEESKRVELRWDFLLDGKLVESRALAPGRVDNNVEVPGGSYDLRVFARRGADGAFQFWKTAKLTVKEDGWLVNIGCE